MKIQGNFNIQKIQKAYTKNVGKVNGTEKSEMKRDKIEISQSSKEFQIAMDAFKKLPDVRQDKVDEVKESIKNDTYKPSTEDIIKKMLSNAK
ncbi:MAG: flagellar biosynthesis anti-sigma factor FlgM [Clostridia bacterium]|nr:flagellar biosynthesis anti-sigma factor FlgM [Clostridia bacterium]